MISESLEIGLSDDNYVKIDETGLLAHALKESKQSSIIGYTVETAS